MATATESFKKRCRSGLSNPRLMLTYDGNDYLSEFMEGSSLHKDGSLGVGEISIGMDNSEGHWNHLAAGGSRLGRAASVKMYFTEDASDKLTLFTGIVKHVKFKDDICFLFIRDRMDIMMRTQLGTRDSPVIFTEGHVPAEMAWKLLTAPEVGGVVQGAELDRQKNTNNVDIDYLSWFNWKNALSSWNYDFRAHLAGQSINWALLRICQMTDSYIFVNGEGKFQFSPPATTGEIYNDSNAIIDLSIDPNFLLNRFVVAYGYDYDEGTWSGSVLEGRPASINLFGRHNDSFEDTQIWHSTQASATSMGVHRLNNYSYPIRWFEMQTDLIGVTEQIGNTITPSPGLLGFTAVSTIEDITINLGTSNNTGIVTMRARV